MKYVGHIAIAVTLLGRQKVAPAIEARVDGGIGWQVVISVCRWVVARFIRKVGIDGNCRWSTCRSALELKCALPDIAAICVPGHAAPTAGTAADSHQRPLRQIEDKFGSSGGRLSKGNVGGGLSHRGASSACAHG
jgi:hypothetical protein